MHNLHITEILVILVVALLLFGPGRIGGIGKALGKSINEFRNELKGGKDKEKEPEQKQEKSEE
jgi:sec-independent protein translocase protein TatA